MKTEEFKKELKALLKKYDAYMNIDEVRGQYHSGDPFIEVVGPDLDLEFGYMDGDKDI